MKTEYKSDLKKNYLVIEPGEEVNSEDYDVRMMEQNQIQGFLPMQVRRLDGSCYLYYEITSMQQVELVYGKRQLQSDDIRHIFSEVKDILESARKYLLRPGQILLDPQYMYMEMDAGRISICYLPVKESSFSVLPLAEFILKKLKHEDAEAVSLGYDFYQKATQPNFSLSDTLHEMLAGTYRGGQENGGAGGYKREGYGKEGYERAEQKEAGYKGQGNQEGYEEENIYEMMYGGGEKDFSRVYHKERGKKSGERKKKKQNRIVQAVHPAILILTVLLSAALGGLLYFQLLGFTETGGLFFMLLSVSILLNRFWKNRKERKEKNRRNSENGRKKEKQPPAWQQDPSGEEDPYLEEIQRLREELYGFGKREEPRETGGYGGEGMTQYLDEMGKPAGLSLTSERPEKYPRIFIRDRILIVGKKKSQADIILDEAAVSRIHARLEYHQGGYYVMDLDSRNGTYLNGVRLAPREQTEIRDGDRIAFANISFRASAEDESEMTQLLR